MTAPNGQGVSRGKFIAGAAGAVGILAAGGLVGTELLSGQGNPTTLEDATPLALALALEKLRTRDVLKAIPLHDYVAATSVGIVDGEPLLDLAYEDDSRADVDMNIVKTGGGRFIEVQGTAEAEPFGREALMTLLDLADHGIAQLVEKQRAIVGHLVKTP